MIYLFGVLALAAAIGCNILTNRKGMEFAGGILALPAACFYGYSAVRLATLDAPPMLVVGVGILAAVIPGLMYKMFLQGLPIVDAAGIPKPSRKNPKLAIESAQELGNTLLSKSETGKRRRKIKPAQRPEKPVKVPVRSIQRDVLVRSTPEMPAKKSDKMMRKSVNSAEMCTSIAEESMDTEKERMDAMQEAIQLVEKIRKQEKAMPAFGFQEMLEQGDRLYVQGSYQLALHLYQACEAKAARKEEKELARQRQKWVKDSALLSD